jgi:hypothetical protein
MSSSNSVKLTVSFVVLCLLLVTRTGFAAEPEKAPHSKTTATKQKLKDSGEAEQTKPNTGAITPTQISSKYHKSQVGINPLKPPETPVLSAYADEDKGKQMKWQVVSSGAVEGGTSATFQLRGNPGYVLSGTVGQLAVGPGASDSYGINSGYWQEFEECPGRGDPNGDGIINSADVVFLLSYLFIDGPAPDPLCTGDCTCDGVINSADVVFLLSYLFIDGPPPVC